MATVKAFRKRVDASNEYTISVPEHSFEAYRAGGHHLIDVARLAYQMTGFWASDRWDMLNNPTGRVPRDRDSYRHINFGCENRRVNIELKYVCFYKFSNNIWSPRTNAFAQQIHKIVRFLNETSCKVKSLLDYPLGKWELLLRTYLIEEGLWFGQTRNVINGSQERVVRPRASRTLEVFAVIYSELENSYDERPEYERDIWDAQKMGAEVNLARSETKLNFTQIEPDWLRAACKKYLQLYIATRSLTSASSILTAVTKFGKYLTESHPHLLPEQINRPVLLGYLSYLTASTLTQNIRRDYLQSLIGFLDACAREEWLPITERRLISRDDLPQRLKREPRFIPEFVMRQLEELLPQMPTTLQRLTLILKDCGMRISELCTVKLDCLSQDADGDYFLFYYQAKTKRQHSVPISKEVARVIIAQRSEVIAEKLNTAYLFARSNGKPIKCKYLGRTLNEFAYEHKISDETGKLWRFQAHQFRHTVATRMINSGVAQIFVQRFLGHQSPEMTAVYAQIHDRTMKKSFEQYLLERGDLMDASEQDKAQTKVNLDVTGDVINQPECENYQQRADTKTELLWFKRNIFAQALPNGFCGLPAAQPACTHANACLSCANFRTDASFLPQHKSQLAETRALVQISRHNNWHRQAEVNERVETNLVKIIEHIEGESNGKKPAAEEKNKS